MKGNTQYNLAVELHKKMYFSDSNLSSAEQKKLYDQYLIALRKAAYLGNIDALYDLGQQYEDVGYLGIPNPNYAPQKSIFWYTKACKMGHAEACNNLSAFYEKGQGCRQDIQKALALLKQAADLGSPYGKKNYKLLLNKVKSSIIKN